LGIVGRFPPVSVREQLRKEVNLGCPVQGCGSPYLEYHHFDPPWKEKHHHNPEGMIALCKGHHPEADKGAWTKEQLKAMKKDPYVENEVVGKFNWLRQDIIIMAGVIVQNPQVILKIDGENVVWMEKDLDGYYRLNMNVRDSEGNLVLRILNNDWVAYNESIVDIICPPSGKELSVTSRDHTTMLAIRFDDVSIADFCKRLYAIAEMVTKESERALQEGYQAQIQRMREVLANNTRISDVDKNRILANQMASREPHYNASEEKEIFVSRILKKLVGVERITTCTLNASLAYLGRKIEIKEGVFSTNQINITGGFFCGMKVVYGSDKNGSYLGGN
jgi:hypothetical protein